MRGLGFVAGAIIGVTGGAMFGPQIKEVTKPFVDKIQGKTAQAANDVAGEISGNPDKTPTTDIYEGPGSQVDATSASSPKSGANTEGAEAPAETVSSESSPANTSASPASASPVEDPAATVDAMTKATDQQQPAGVGA